MCRVIGKSDEFMIRIKFKLQFYRSFVRISKQWNELPRDIVEADSLQHFKSKLKLYLTI